MKKILTFFFLISIISVSAFAKNFFDHRYFEIKTGTNFDISNNLFAANDFMKQNLVIDLRKIADECPENGFNIRTDVSPSVEMNLNIKDFHLGIASGVEVYEDMDLGKGLFDLLGYGNTIGETLEFSFKNDADVFAYSQIGVGFAVGKLKLRFTPAVFIPIISVHGGGGELTVLNDSDGNLKVAMDINMDVYSVAEMKSEGDGVNFDYDSDKILNSALHGYGFDLAAGFSYPLGTTINVDLDFRVPVLPGYLNYKSTINGGFEYNMKLTDFQSSEKTSKDTTVTNVEERIAINRPLKTNVYFSQNLLGNIFNTKAGLGFGIRRPFSDYSEFYPEYYFGMTLNLVEVFKIGFSTQYTNQLFIHQLGTTLNLRLIQFDLGISTQSSSFKKSVSVGGVGVYTYITIGF